MNVLDLVIPEAARVDEPQSFDFSACPEERILQTRLDWTGAKW